MAGEDHDPSPNHAQAIARVRSSALGRFRIALAAGTYRQPRGAPQAATVSSHRYTTVLISYDSGIRWSGAVNRRMPRRNS